MRSIFCERKYSSVSRAPSRIGSVISIKASFDIFTGILIFLLSIFSFEKAKAKTREPRESASFACFRVSPKIISGAPRKSVPTPSTSIEPHFRSLEKGIIFVASKVALFFEKYLRIACAVGLLSSLKFI